MKMFRHDGRVEGELFCKHKIHSLRLRFPALQALH
jgi:hypothetical protein